MNYLSSNIRFLRQQNNLTQEQLAKIVNKSRVLISQWESDDREITTEDIIKLSDYFNVPMDALVGKNLKNNEVKNFNELELLFDKYKDILSKSDEEHIKFIIEQRIKEIDEGMERKQ